jgi:hypothetical protein
MCINCEVKMTNILEKLEKAKVTSILERSEYNACHLPSIMARLKICDVP